MNAHTTIEEEDVRKLCQKWSEKEGFMDSTLSYFVDVLNGQRTLQEVREEVLSNREEEKTDPTRCYRCDKKLGTPKSNRFVMIARTWGKQ